jgi:hypothetical protein
MEQARFELKGWKAAAVAVVIVGMIGYRTSTRFRTVDDAGQKVLRTWLVRDFQGLGPKGLAQRVADYRAGVRTQEEAPSKVPEVEITSLSAHGLPDSMVVRVEVTVDGAPPPDGRPVRYLRLMRRVEGDWFVFTETDSFRYYQTLML